MLDRDLWKAKRDPEKTPKNEVFSGPVFSLSLARMHVTPCESLTNETFGLKLVGLEVFGFGPGICKDEVLVRAENWVEDPGSGLILFSEAYGLTECESERLYDAYVPVIVISCWKGRSRNDKRFFGAFDGGRQ